MATQRTLSIIKPEAVHNNNIGAIVSRFESQGLTVVAARMQHLTKAEAEGFYAVHKERPFFGELVEYITSGPVFIMTLEGENAIARNREIMGATNPAEAAPGTIRADFGESIGVNTVHGSDAEDTAKNEIAFFFQDGQVCNRCYK